MFKPKALKRALKVFSYRQLHGLLGLYEHKNEQLTYIQLSDVTGIYVSTFHGSAGVRVLEQYGMAEIKRNPEVGKETLIKITADGCKLVESLFREEAKL